MLNMVHLHLDDIIYIYVYLFVDSYRYELRFFFTVTNFHFCTAFENYAYPLHEPHTPMYTMLVMVAQNDSKALLQILGFHSRAQLLPC